MYHITDYFIRAGRGICNLFFPPQCMACRVPVEAHGALCSPCWNGVEYITAPQCTICGFPFDYAVEGRQICGQCTASPPPYTMARAVCKYNDVSGKLVTRFKYSDQTYMAPSLGKWLVQAGREFLGDADIIAPVPLHPYRLLKRRYNQSALLVQKVAGHCPNIVMKLQLVKRKRHTPPQTGLTQRQRQDNVKGAFVVNARYKEYIRNKHIVLVDDVMTTGATLNACASALLKGGARRVDVLTLCQTFK